MDFPRQPTAAITMLTLVAGFTVAQATNQVLGGAVLVAGVAWCALREVRRTRWWRIAVVVVVGAGSFAAAHVVAPTVGGWPAVVMAALVLGAATYLLVDRPGEPAREKRES